MSTLGIVLLVATIAALVALLAVAVMSMLGHEPNQTILRRSLRSCGSVLCGVGVISGEWTFLLSGLACLVLSHPRVNLPGIARKVDESMGGSSHDHHSHSL